MANLFKIIILILFSVVLINPSLAIADHLDCPSDVTNYSSANKYTKTDVNERNVSCNPGDCLKHKEIPSAKQTYFVNTCWPKIIPATTNNQQPAQGGQNQPPAPQSQTNSPTQGSTATTTTPPKSLNEALKTILGSGPVKTETGITNLGTLVSRVLNAVFMLAGLLLFVFMLIGVMQYIFAGGEKEKLGKARARITQALIGFVIIMLSFMISSFVSEVLAPKFPPITPVTVPK